MAKQVGETVKYTVEIYKSPKGYHLACPALSGCVSQGDSLPQAMENMKKAIRDYHLMIKRASRNKTTAEVHVVV